MTTLSPTHLSQLEAVARAATPGPWRNGADPCHFDSPEVTDDKTFSYYVTTDANAAHIAAFSPSVALAIIERVRELEAGMADACKWLDDFVGSVMDGTSDERWAHARLERLTHLAAGDTVKG